MDSRKLNVSFNKSGRGTYTPRITLPIKYIKDMGITNEDRQVKVQYNFEKKEIIIRKNDKTWN